MTESFAYHRSVAPGMWAFVALASIELVVVHLLLMLWRPWLAAILSALTLTSIAWLIGVIRSFGRLPVTIDGRALVMRVGTLSRLVIPVEDIAGLRTEWDGALVKRRTTLNLALIAYPNVVVDLARPRPGRRGVIAVAHRLDQPEAFVAAIERLGVRG